MTTVTELIAYLQTLPPETTVEVLEEESAGYATLVTWTDLELPVFNTEYIEYSSTIEFCRSIAGYAPSLSFGKRS